MIKMRDIQSVEADFEHFKIFLRNKNGTSLGSIECGNRYSLLERLEEMIKYLEESIDGRDISMRLPESQKLDTQNSSMTCDSLFMDFSSTD